MLSFTEHIALPPESAGELSASAQRVARLLFLAAGLSYYKASAAPKVIVDGGLSEAERTFLWACIRSGLGEFAYRNELPGPLEPRIVGDEVPPTEHHLPDAFDVDAPPLVAVGGGKDSAVAAELARPFAPVLFSVNEYKAVTATVEASGLPYLRARRTLDPRLFELNDAGALNGHIPVTAVNSLIALLVAETSGLGPAVFANERSAQSGNVAWHDLEVNHQWSKSTEFEALLRDTLTAIGLSPDRYFSVLRPLTELDIARRFARLPKYHNAFTSCNRAFRISRQRPNEPWCCDCPKCYFVFLVLAPFLPRAELVRIFDCDLFDAPARPELYREILGVEGHKPFECVGEYDEARAALVLAAREPEWDDAKGLQQLLADVEARGLTPTDQQIALMLRPGSDAFLPPRYADELRANTQAVQGNELARG